LNSARSPEVGEVRPRNILVFVEVSCQRLISHDNLHLPLCRHSATRIEQSGEAVRQQKTIAKKLELNPEARA